MDGEGEELVKTETKNVETTNKLTEIEPETKPDTSSSFELPHKLDYKNNLHLSDKDSSSIMSFL